MKHLLMVVVLMTVQSVLAQKQTDIQKLQSSVSIEYGAHDPDEGGRFGADFVYKHIVVGGSYSWLNNKIDSGEFQAKNSQGIEAHLGGNYRYFVAGEVLYFEGRMLVGYSHAFREYLAGKRYVTHTSGFGKIQTAYTETEDIWKTYSEGDLYLGFTPRIGLCLGNVSVVAGYRWDFPKFVFRGL